MKPLLTAAVYLTWFLSTYYLVFFLLVLFSKKNNLYERKKLKKTNQKVSIIVPAYNEEGKIAYTIRSLKKLNYPNYEVIVVNDGSTDNTGKEALKEIGNDRRFRYFSKKNGGKASALNFGIKKAKGKFVACMDADSVVEKEMFNKTLPYFEDPKVGSVTVTIEVKNTKKFLNKLVEIEFKIGLSLFLKVFSLFNCVFVTPGPFSIYRKSVLEELNGFDENNMTEDLEITYRIHKAGYLIKNAMEAKARTLCPETFKGLYIQRKRWYGGAIQTLFKHKDVPFNRKYGAFGFFIPFNYLLIFTGLGLFFITTYMGLSRGLKNLYYLNYTNFNIFSRLKYINFDILRTNSTMLFGWFAFLSGIILMFIGLKATRSSYSKRKIGMLGFPFFFFLYQIFWAGAILNIITGRKIKWR